MNFDWVLWKIMNLYIENEIVGFVFIHKLVDTVKKIRIILPLRKQFFIFNVNRKFSVFVGKKKIFT